VLLILKKKKKKLLSIREIVLIKCERRENGAGSANSGRERNVGMHGTSHAK
jgi:hypothetical protein